MTDFFQRYLPLIEKELQKQVARLDHPTTRIFYEMLTYHMGWTGDGAGPQASGKRIRPMLALLTAEALGGDPQAVLPAAAAIELVHNFSLVHDDIQDNSNRRRGRPTVWKIWGIPHAINAGDALFVLANLAITDLQQNFPAKTALEATRILQETCLALTRGQYLDMSYETRDDLTPDDYWPMIAGKTAALLQACSEIGALLAGAPDSVRESCRAFGHYLGLAFQVQDDILGIWGDEAQTGKSAASDLLERKKSLPVLYGLQKRGQFWQRWQSGPITQDEVATVAAILQEEGAYDYAQSLAEELTDKALAALQAASLQGEAGQALHRLARQLLNRQQ